MRAKITFLMKDRHEYEFDIEGDSQNTLYDLGKQQLDEKLTELADIVPGTPPPEFWVIETWRTVPEDEVPGKDKMDGVAARSPLQKVRFDLLPLGPLTQVAQVFTWGAYTYGDRNWEAGFSWSRCIGSSWRHLIKWLSGEECDDESGLPHLAHTIANLLFLMQYTITGKGKDDRQKLDSRVITELFTPINAETPKKES